MLKQELIEKVMAEAGKRLAAIDANAGVIAEAEALAKNLNAVSSIEFTPLVTVHDNSVTPRAFAHGVRDSEVRRAIAKAGLVIEAEGQTYSPKDRFYTIAGLTSRVEVNNVFEELLPEAA